MNENNRESAKSDAKVLAPQHRARSHGAPRVEETYYVPVRVIIKAQCIHTSLRIERPPRV